MTYMLDLRLFQAFCICDRCGLKVRVTSDRPPDCWIERSDDGETRHYCADHGPHGQVEPAAKGGRRAVLGSVLRYQ